MATKSIALVGANSFLATSIISELAPHAYQLHLYGRREPKTDAHTRFTFFSYPDAPINFEELPSFDAVVYTAGAGIQSNVATTSELIYQVNAFLPIQLIQYLQDVGYKGHVVTFGSYFEIGNSLVDKPYTEEEYVTNSNAVPNNYCISKRLLTQYISQKLNNLSFYLTHFVLPNIYGVGENQSRIIPYLVENMQHKTPINLSSGTQVRQFLHVRDAAAAVQMALEQPRTGIYNLGSTQVLSIRELVETVLNEAPDKESLEVNFGSISKKDAGMQFLALDATKAEQEWAWKASIPLLEGIREYFAPAPHQQIPS